MGADEAILAEELAAIMRLGDHDDVSAVLDRVVRSVTNAVPDCDHATVATLRGGLVRTAAGDTEPLLSYRDASLEHNAGPTIDALELREPVGIDDVRRERRWSSSRIRMRCAGYTSCLALPLSARREPPTVLTLYSRQPDALTGTSRVVAELFAAQASVSVDNARLYSESVRLIEQLHVALASRTVIAQAQGIVMDQYRCAPHDAIALLKQVSQHTNKRLRTIAAELANAQHDISAAMRRLGLPAPTSPTPPRSA